jgi:hypothetical protein
VFPDYFLALGKWFQESVDIWDAKARDFGPWLPGSFLIGQVSLNRVYQKNADAHDCNNRNDNLEHRTVPERLAREIGRRRYVSHAAERFTESAPLLQRIRELDHLRRIARAHELSHSQSKSFLGQAFFDKPKFSRAQLGFQHPFVACDVVLNGLQTSDFFVHSHTPK